MNLSFILHKSPDFIFDYLTDMDKFASIHPVISRIDKTGENKFLVHETLKLGFIPFSFTYPVSIESNRSAKTVTIKATVMKLTHIEMIFSIRSEGNHSVVDESISFKSFLPVKAVMEKVFREQHTLLFQNMDKV
ncbi:MAG TPA: SRPBCC domain-containing protein [Saprospiraceae bacterium]|nr:SRPBCC domain-containing protein [Saprospiraceae bacterium]